MAKHILRRLVILLSVIAAGIPMLDAAEKKEPITALPVKEINVHKIRLLDAGGQGVSWGANNQILLARQGVSRYFSVNEFSPDGMKRRDLTLGMDRTGTRRHFSSPAWHPSAKFFAFVAQNEGSNSYRMSLPGTGLNCNLWASDADGRFWQLTTLGTGYNNPRGVVSPVFSPDGTMLAWAGNTGNYPPESIWGERAIYLADFFIADGRPKIGEIEMIQPGEQKDFYETCGFSADGTKLIYSANPDKDQSVAGMDICALNLKTKAVSRLTQSPGEWDQFASLSPDGSKILWMSSRGTDLQGMSLNMGNWQRYLKSELWLMNADGTDAKQFTFFNTNGAPEFQERRCYVGESSWSPDGSEIAIILNYEDRNFSVESMLLVLTLGKGDAPVPEEKAVAKPRPTGATNTPASRENPGQSYQQRRQNMPLRR